MLDHYSIAPSQLCPGGLKIILALDMLAASQGLQPLSIDDFQHSYFLRDHDRDRGRYSVYVLSKLTAPIINLPTRDDTAWKLSFFLVRGNIFAGAEPLVPQWKLIGKRLIIYKNFGPQDLTYQLLSSYIFFSSFTC